MSHTLTIPKEYGYVIVAASSSFFVTFWQGFYAAALRRGTGLTMPNVFADSAAVARADTPDAKKALYRSNCAHRAHANSVEGLPSVIAATLLAGIEFPVVAAVLGATWSLSRIPYTLGYAAKNGSKGEGRYPGYVFSTLSSLGLFGMTAYTGIKMAL